MLGKVMVSSILILSLMLVSRRYRETFALSYSYDVANLSRALRQAYREGGTIGVLQQQQQMWSTISPISEDVVLIRRQRQWCMPLSTRREGTRGWRPEC